MEVARIWLPRFLFFGRMRCSNVLRRPTWDHDQIIRRGSLWWVTGEWASSKEAAPFSAIFDYMGLVSPIRPGINRVPALGSSLTISPNTPSSIFQFWRTKCTDSYFTPWYQSSSKLLSESYWDHKQNRNHNPNRDKSTKSCQDSFNNTTGNACPLIKSDTSASCALKITEYA